MKAEYVSVYEAKSRFSELIAKAKAGQPSIITNRGKPQAIVQAVPNDQEYKLSTRIGFLKDELADFTIPEDFNTMMQDEIAAMFGGDT